MASAIRVGQAVRVTTPARAGAGMDHPFLAAVADGLSARGVATLRCAAIYARTVRRSRT